MIPVRLKKILSDLATRWGRTLLTLAGLSLGLYGLCSVLVAFVILSGDLNENFRATNPANVVIQTEAMDLAALARIEAIQGVGDVETRTAVAGRLYSDLGWIPISLFVIDDFDNLRIARFYSQEGAWPPPTGSLLIERDGRFFVRSPLGTSMRLRIGGSVEVQTPLSGLVYDPGQAPSRMERALYGYVSTATLAAWGVTPPRTRVLITASDPTSARRIARDAEAALRAAGQPVHRVEIYDSPEHPHQFQLNAMVAILAGIGLASLLLCVVLVINLIDALMASEQRAIGVMRALGGRSGQIGRDYLLGVGILGLVACAIATPFALPMGRGLAQFVARMLNFNLLSDVDPIWIGAAILAVGFLLPVLAAFVRVQRSVSMPVRDALARIDPSQLGPIAQRIGALFTPLPLTLRAAARAVIAKPRRALFTASALTFGLVFFLAALNIRTSLWETVEAVGRTKPFDILIMLRGPHETAQLDAWLSGASEVARTEYWSGGEGVLYGDGLQVSNPAAVLAPPAESWALRPEVIEGAWLSEPNDIVVTQNFLGGNPLIRVGDRYHLSIGGERAEVRLAGVVREFGPGLVYASPQLVGQLTGQSGRANMAFLDLGESGDAYSEFYLASTIEEAAPAAGVSIAGATTSGQLELIVVNHLQGIALILEIIAGIALAVGAVAVASSISVSVVERYREVGVLKAIGGRSLAVASLFITEAALIALIGWLGAVAIAPWLSRTVAALFGTVIIEYPFDYRAFPWGWALALGAALSTAVIASLMPIRSALRMTIYRALRSE